MTDFEKFPETWILEEFEIFAEWKDKFVAQLKELIYNPLAEYGLHEQTKELIDDILEAFA